MRTQRAKAIYDGAMGKMPKTYHLNYVDYRDNINHHGSVIEQCLEDKSCCPLWEEDWYGEQTSDATYDEAENLLSSMGISDDALKTFKCDFPDLYDEIRYEISNRNMDDPIKEVLGNSRISGFVRIASNCELAEPHYMLGSDFMGDEYLVQLMSWLRLNPAKVKKTLTGVFGVHPSGRWPNCPSRDGKEIVSYEDFCRTYFECPNYAFFAFFGMLPLQELYDNNFEWESGFSIPAGTVCGFFNTWNGGGTLHLIRTIRNVSIDELKKSHPHRHNPHYDRLELCVDEKGCSSRYSSGEVYGCTLNSKELLTA